MVNKQKSENERKRGVFLETSNIPLQVISVCSTKGEFLPLRFRYEDKEYGLQTVEIIETVCTKEIKYVGIEAFLYTCKAILHGTEKLFELKYTVQTHNWVLFRILY